MYKVELIASGGVVGSFKVALNISLASLSSWVEEAIKAHGEQRGIGWLYIPPNSFFLGRVIGWQVRRPDDSVLCRVKVQGA